MNFTTRRLEIRISRVSFSNYRKSLVERNSGKERYVTKRGEALGIVAGNGLTRASITTKEVSDS